MLKNLFLPLLCLATATAATAQTDCAKPVVKLLRNKKEIPATASALFAAITLRVAPDAGCPEQRYRFRDAEVTLVRKGRMALPTLLVRQPQVDLSSMIDRYQSGDHLFVFIAYHNIALVGPDGTLTPLRPAKGAKPRPGQLDLQPDESRGISFIWPLVKP
jgi:hypothetical protein